MRRLTQIFLVLLLAAFVFLPQSKARADVYGYVLKINISDTDNTSTDKEIANGGSVTKEDVLNGQLKATVTVYDPSDTSLKPGVSDWAVSVKSFDPAGNEITSSGGVWSLENISKNANTYSAQLKLTDSDVLSGFYSIISAQATVAVNANPTLYKQTNLSTFKTTILDIQTPVPPTSVGTSGDNTSLDQSPQGLAKILGWVRANLEFAFTLIFLIILVIVIIFYSRRNKNKEPEKKAAPDTNFPKV
jgi:hypothetical protein